MVGLQRARRIGVLLIRLKLGPAMARRRAALPVIWGTFEKRPQNCGREAAAVAVTFSQVPLFSMAHQWM